MAKLSNKILDKIKKEQVTPKPKWYFILMHSLLGLAILGSIVMGSLAFAIVIRHLTLTDWELARYVTGGHVRTFIRFVPYIWLLFLGVLIFIADTLFKQTKKGYRFNLWIIVAVSLVLSMAFGGIIYAVKADQPLENSLRRNFRPYLEWERRRAAILASPEAGVITGQIREVNDEKEIKIVDYRGNEWSIDISHMDLEPDFSPEIGMEIGTIGERKDGYFFKSRRLRRLKRDYWIDRYDGYSHDRNSYDFYRR